MHRGALTVIFEDHHYTSMIHSGMYPSHGVREALEEAADIARKGEWGQVAEGWTTKGHLFGVDLTRPEHPVVQDLAAEVDQRSALIGPSWRGIADEPVYEAWPLGHRQQEWVVVADLDHEQIVAFEMRPDGLDSMPVAAATADTNDPVAISQIAADLAASGDQLGGRPSVSTRREWNWRADPEDPESHYPDYICDVPTGQWRRPEGMSPLSDTPDDYPALSYGGWGKPQWEDKSTGDELPEHLLAKVKRPSADTQDAFCNAPTAVGGRCTHPRPRSGKCPAGHIPR